MITEKIREYNKGIKTHILRIIPQSYRDNPLTLNTIYKWVLIGLLIRFVFMPFACHGDLISTYHRSYLILEGSTNLSLYTLVQLIQSFFLFIYQFFLPLEKLLLWPQNSLSVPVPFWLNEFAKNNMAYRALFLFKIPYLIFDLASAFIFLHLFREEKKGILAFKFWMINPVGIFATYIFARYEVIPIFFILLSLFYVRSDKAKLSLFILGISIITRFYPLLFLLPFSIILGKNIQEKVKLAFCGILPLLLVTIPSLIGGKTTEVGAFSESRFIDFLLGMNFNIGYGNTIFLFIGGYTLILLYCYYNLTRSFKSLWECLFIILLLLFATSYFHPQYFMWITPFIALAITENKRFLELHAMQIFCFIIYTFQWGKPLAGYLFASIDPSLFTSFPSPSELISYYYPALKFINLIRSIFSGICIWIMYLIYKDMKSDVLEEER